MTKENNQYQQRVNQPKAVTVKRPADSLDDRNPAAVALGSLGGKARHESLSPERRMEISKLAWQASIKARKDARRMRRTLKRTRERMKGAK